jgi:hypothetical protein
MQHVVQLHTSSLDAEKHALKDAGVVRCTMTASRLRQLERGLASYRGYLFRL